MAGLIVIYDACILYSAPLRDLFMRLALTDLYQAKWTNDIHEEWIRNLLKNRPDLTRAQLEKTKEKMNMHVRDCLITRYKHLIKSIRLPDPNDKHVLAAAIQASAHIILTFNTTDFPSRALEKYNIKAQHPDLFLQHLLALAPSLVIQTIQETRRSLKKPPKATDEYLAILEQQSLPKTVRFLRQYKDLI